MASKQKPSAQDAIGVFAKTSTPTSRGKSVQTGTGNASSGTVNGLAFATAQGQPKGTPADVPPFNMNQQNRPQESATAEAPPVPADVSAQSRAQTMGTAAQRLGSARGSMPTVGRPDVVPTATPAYRQGCGSIDDNGKAVGKSPMKFKS